MRIIEKKFIGWVFSEPTYYVISIILTILFLPENKLEFTSLVLGKAIGTLLIMLIPFFLYYKINNFFSKKKIIIS